MEYRQLGRTDVKVSVICLGTMTFGEQNSESESHQQLDFAVDHGVSFFDTAELYAIPPRAETCGLSERYFGTWLASRGQRDRIVLATKAAGPGEWVNYIRGGPRLDRQNLRAAVDGSLERLQTDYIDLYQLHWPERSTNYFGRLGYEHDERTGVPIAETMEALGELVDAGKIRFVGVSNETPWGIAEFLRISREQGLARIVSVQNPYNLLNRTFEIGAAEFAHREDVGLLAYSPMAMGVLSGKYLDGQRPRGARLTLFTRFDRYTKPECERATKDYVTIARDAGLDPAQMALAFVNSRPFLTSTIIGATTLAQLGNDIDSVDLDLPTGVTERIAEIHQRFPNPAP
jgi:aryl-alcohol dehydrogenase-like predicted oxidoreductase